MDAERRDDSPRDGQGEGRIRLAGSDWLVWPEAAVRSAGFPADGLDVLCDPELAAVADAVVAGTDPVTAPVPADGPPGPAGRPDQGSWPQVYAAATGRLSAAVRGIAADPRFREAVAWQNPALLGTCLDRTVAGEPRNVRGRNHESAIASYWQRYTMKNDSVGFFGPVGWASFCTGVRGIEAVAGPGLVRHGTAYFECWAIDELARAIAAEDGVADWTRPVLASSYSVRDGQLRRPRQEPVPLPPLHAALAGRADGTHTRRALCRLVADEAGAGMAEAERALADLERAGYVRSDLEVGVQAFPERALERRLRGIEDLAVRERALARLAELTAARARLQQASTDDVPTAVTRLGQVFEQLTNTAPNRRSGQAYAGRTVAYLDTVRDVDVRLGVNLLDWIAVPLAVVLDSARWLVHRAAAEFSRVLHGYWAAEADPAGGPGAVGRTGESEPDAVPIAVLMAAATRELTVADGVLPEPVRAAVAEFQSRWRRLLGPIDPAAPAHRADPDEAASRARDLFAASPAGWSSARLHSPDLMFAVAEAPGADPVLCVLGELHLAGNTLESGLFVRQHPDPARLLGRSVVDHGGRRFYPVHAKSSPYVTSRVAPPSALLDGRYTYWSWAGGHDSVDAPGPVLAGADLLVRRVEGDLVVDFPDGRRAALLEVLGELLSPAVLNAFSPVPVARHRPRVSLGPLVIAREAWRFTAADAGWATVRDERDRFLAARAWRTRVGLPERAFMAVPGRKPVVVDFRSIVLVNLLAKSVRALRADRSDRAFVLSEVLPDTGQLWLRDAEGRRYTSEIRMVCVDAAGR